MTIIEALKMGTDTLVAAGVPDASYDAEILMEYVTGLGRAKLLTRQRSQMEPKVESDFFDLIEKRAERIPLQQLTHVQEFMGIPIYVDERVLCPRLDTETLAMEIRAVLDGIYRVGGLLPAPENVVPLRHDVYFDKRFRLLDLCTGSGCVALATYDYAKRRGFALDITAVDASEDALAVAEKNKAARGADITLLHGDLYEPVRDQSFHVITANPPYIASRYLKQLMPEVRDHEPRMALDGGEDGLIYYHRITEGAAEHLEDGGFLMYEIGFDQGEAVSEIMTGCGFSEVRVIKDLAGDDRVVCGHL